MLTRHALAAGIYLSVQLPHSRSQVLLRIILMPGECAACSWHGVSVVLTGYCLKDPTLISAWRLYLFMPSVQNL